MKFFLVIFVPILVEIRLFTCFETDLNFEKSNKK